MSLPDTLRTERLLLRPPRADDAEWIFESYAQDPEVSLYLTWAPHQEIAQTRAFLAELAVSLGGGHTAGWVIEVQGEGPAGMITASGVQGFKPELGYVIARAFWGREIMTEAVAAVVDALFALPHVQRVQALVDCANPASARVLEKAGLRQEGLLRKFGVHPNASPGPRDVTVHARVREG